MAKSTSHMTNAKDHLGKAALEVKEAVAEQVQTVREDAHARIINSRDAVKSSLGEAKGLLSKTFSNLKDAVLAK